MSFKSIAGGIRAHIRASRPLMTCERGIAAVEFALIVPVMLMMFIGTVELSQAITVDRRVTSVASSTADLVARQKTITTAQMASYMQAISQIMAPYSGTPMKITVANVYATVAAPTTYKVCWVYQYNSGANTSLQNGGTYPSADMPAGIVVGGTSVVIVEVAYAYAPVVLFHGSAGHVGASYVGAGYTLREKFFLKPRLSASIQYDTTAACV